MGFSAGEVKVKAVRPVNNRVSGLLMLRLKYCITFIIYLF